MLFDHCSTRLEDFLGNYWQKKPLLIRQAFPGFQPELEADDIAGLACDEFAESRLVCGSFPRNDWELRYGPFTEDDFGRLPARDWTLLVQDVEKHYPPLRELLQEFGFIPSWRIDDLMVSVAAPGGSVGPHVDQYDVFLLQAAGKRRWQIAESFDPELQAGTELNVLRRFEAEQEWLLEPGDMLYLPPGVAHHGVAVEQCMTWSVGLRAPSTADLLQSLGEWLAACRAEGSRYRDPDSSLEPQPGEVDAAATGAFRPLAANAMGPEADFDRFLGEFLSRYRLAREPAPPPEGLSAEALLAELGKGARLRHNPWTRLLWIRSGNSARLFAAGAEHDCSVDTARLVCDPECLAGDLPGQEPRAIELLCKLVNDGHLYLDSEK